jgi:hypothetical protein
MLPLFLLCVVGAAAQTSRNAAESQPAATVSVRGIAVDSRTGKPLSGVHVMLTSDAGLESEIVYGAMSDAQGRFSIPDIPAGDYTGSAEKRGFLFLPDRKKTKVTWYGGALSLKFRAGERPADLVLPMIERAIIAGRVLDEHGDPLINAEVTAFSLNQENGAACSTNGRGEFRLSVPPGKYTVEGSRFWAAETTGSVSGYVRTYYPSAREIRNATVVEAFAQRVVSGVEIKLVRPAAFHVGGEITGFPDGDRSLTLFWRSADSERLEGWSSGTLDFSTKQARPSGETSSINFYSSSLPVGTYYLWAECCDRAGEELRSQTAEVTLSDSDVTGIALELVSGAEITGTIIRPRGFVPLPGQTISVQLPFENSRTGSNRNLTGEMNAAGRFRINNVFPGRYRLKVSSLPEDVYVQSVMLNNSAVRAGLLDLSGGAVGAKLKIVLSGGAARLSGLVKEAKIEAPQKHAEVLLFPEREGQAVDQAECLSAEANESGAYSFQSLPPGRFRILTRAHYTEKQCEEAAAQIRRGLIVESIELKPGEKAMKNLRMVREAADESRP